MKKTAIIYAHASKESNCAAGEQLGLDEGALSVFKYACSEVKIEVSVGDDGIVEIMKVDDIPLARLVDPVIDHLPKVARKEESALMKRGDIKVIRGTNEVAIVINAPDRKASFFERQQRSTIGKMEIIGKLNYDQAEIYWEAHPEG